MTALAIQILVEMADTSGSVLAFVTIFAIILLGLVVILALMAYGLSILLYRQKLHFRHVVESREQLLKKCPTCGNFMQPDDSYCPNCGRRVPKVTTVK
jgi:tRNA(Ile2) C34 agmatinyltransferase TiaS